jgi:hypothetical protein
VKIPPVGADSIHADGWTDRHTDMTKLIVAFRNFVNAPKNWLKTLCRALQYCAQIPSLRVVILMFLVTFFFRATNQNSGTLQFRVTVRPSPVVLLYVLTDQDEAFACWQWQEKAEFTVVYSCFGTKQTYLRLLWALCLIWAHNTCGYQTDRQTERNDAGRRKDFAWYRISFHIQFWYHVTLSLQL